MTLTMFVSSAGSTAGKPDEAVNNLRLQLPPKSDRIDDENRDVFPVANQKAANFEAQGISDALVGDFKAGQRVRVTIEVIED